MDSKIEAIVFDLDGTLFDGFGIILNAYQRVAADMGYPPPTAAEMRGQMSLAPPVMDIVQNFFPGADIGQCMTGLRKYAKADVGGYAKYAGLIEILTYLETKGMKMAILTGGDHLSHDVLAKHEVDKFFCSVVHCNRVQRGKPHPEGFLLAMDECGVSPRAAVMIGDSASDIFAGKNAGAKYTIGITHGHGSREDLKASDPDYIVDSLTELQEVLAKLIV